MSLNSERPLRIALLVYRGNPRSGGQGVYVRHLSGQLAALGHDVTVFAGRPYPELLPAVALERLPSLDLYRDADPFRRPAMREITSVADVVEVGTMWSGSFAEPRSFTRRARTVLLGRREDFDLVHDDQGLGQGLLQMVADGWPVIASVHHPVTVDRAIDLSYASSPKVRRSLRRWYRFSAMQARVARRLPRVLTVSSSSKADIVTEMGVDAHRIGVVPVGVDPSVFRPIAGVQVVAGRIMTTASADVPLKGLGHLLEALAKVRTEREDAHLVVVGRLRPDGPAAETVRRLGLEGCVTFVSGEQDDAIARRYAEAEVAVVPSVYEGFSLPAIEAMASGRPLVATSGGALPEVVGIDRDTARLVAPSDPSALAAALIDVLSDRDGAAAMAVRGRQRVLDRFSWRTTASATVEEYRALLDGRTC